MSHNKTTPPTTLEAIRAHAQREPTCWEDHAIRDLLAHIDALPVLPSPAPVGIARYCTTIKTRSIIPEGEEFIVSDVYASPTGPLCLYSDVRAAIDAAVADARRDAVTR